MHGVNLYIGTTGTGKTFAALEDLRQLQMPRAILDLGGSALLAKIPKAASPKVLREEGRWTPETAEELEAILDALYKRGNVAILVDDAAALRAPLIGKLCRLWRARNLRLFITTQHVSGDIEQAIMACDPLIHAFRTTSPRSLEWLKKWHELEASEVAQLGMGEALELTF